MKVYFLFGIPLEDVCQKMAEDLSSRYGISKFCGMVCGNHAVLVTTIVKERNLCQKQQVLMRQLSRHSRSIYRWPLDQHQITLQNHQT